MTDYMTRGANTQQRSQSLLTHQFPGGLLGGGSTPFLGALGITHCKIALRIHNTLAAILENVLYHISGATTLQQSIMLPANPTNMGV